MEKFIQEQQTLNQDLQAQRDSNNAGVERKLEIKKQEGDITFYTAEITK